MRIRHVRPVPYLGLLLLVSASLFASNVNAQWKVESGELSVFYPDWRRVFSIEDEAADLPDDYLLSRGYRALAEEKGLTDSKTDFQKQFDFMKPDRRISRLPEGEEGMSFFQDVEDAFNRLIKIYSRAGFPEPDFLAQASYEEEDSNSYLINLYSFNEFSWDPQTPTSPTGKVGGYLSGPCTVAEMTGNPDHYAIIALNLDVLLDKDGKWAEQEIYLIVAHELFHAIQYRALLNQGLDACQMPHAWLEGTAHAVAVYLTELAYPGYLKNRRVRFDGNTPPSSYSPTTDQGWFDYPLNWTQLKREGTAARTQNNHGGYGSGYMLNAMFRYAMEREMLFANDKGLEVGKLFLENLETMQNNLPDYPAYPAAKRQADWLNELLSKNGGKNRLQLFFPEFLAHHADSWKKRYDLEDEDAWVDALFNGCHDITLKQGSPVGRTTVSLQQNSAQCFDVTVEDLATNPAQCFHVFGRAMISGPSSDTSTSDADSALDRLHLSAPQLGGTLSGGGTYDCYGGTAGNTFSRSDLFKCLATPLTYIVEKEDQRGKTEKKQQIVTVASEKARWERSWRMIGQVADASTVKNRYILSMVVAGRVSLRAEAYDVEVEFGLRKNMKLKFDNSELSNCSGGGTSETMGVVPPHPVKGANMLAAFQPRLGPFFPNMWAMQPGEDDWPESGIPWVLVTEIDEYFTDEPEGARSQFQFFFEPALAFGETGTFPAAIGGLRMGEGDHIMGFGNVGDEPSGRVEVVQFDRDALHLKLSGQYCEIKAPDYECRGSKSVSVEMVRPFGWAHDIAQRPTSVITPITELYARQIDAILWGSTAMPPGEEEDNSQSRQGSGPGGGNTTSGSGAPGSAMGFGGSEACTCSCEEFEKINKIAEDMDEFQDDEMPDFSNPDMALMMCAMQCMTAYAACATEDIEDF